MKWINCFDEMPKKHENVIVWVHYANDRKESFTESWIDDDGWAMGSKAGFIVTHWLRIAAPKK